MHVPIPSVTLVGEGRLRALLDEACQPLAPSPSAAVVAAHDTWDPERDARLAASANDDGLPFVAVSADAGELWLGPWVASGRAGCPLCVDARRAVLHPKRAYRAAGLDAARGGDTNGWLAAVDAATARAVVAVVADDLRAAAGARLEGTVMVWSLLAGDTEAYPLVAFPRCPRCLPLPDDDAASAEVRMVPRPAGPDPTRAAGGTPDPAWLRERFLGPRVGVIARADRVSSPLPMVLASLPDPRSEIVQPGAGRTVDFAAAEAVAVLESLERYAGMEPRGREPKVVAAADDLDPDTVVDPRDFVLHDPEQYALPGFPFAAFDPKLPRRWLWGHSIRRDGPVLVPAELGYYGHWARAHGEARALAFDISNGCALGSCREEAILHGLFEVFERDAFLMTWYARLSPPGFDLGSARDPRIEVVAARLAERGFRTWVFDTTLEFGVPSVWTMAERVDDGDGMHILCSAGCSLDAERAAWAGLVELASSLDAAITEFDEQRARADQMQDDPELVLEMDDHVVVSAHERGRERVRFLLDAPAVVGFEGRSSGLPVGDVTETLRALLGRVVGAGLDVVVIDQTTPELADAGLTCMKVHVPGTLPMTFGTRFRRTNGCSRLDRRLDGRAMNLFPHPFP